MSDLDLFMLAQLVVQKKQSKPGTLSALKRMTNDVILSVIVLATMSIGDDIIRN